MLKIIYLFSVAIIEAMIILKREFIIKLCLVKRRMKPFKVVSSLETVHRGVVLDMRIFSKY